MTIAVFAFWCSVSLALYAYFGYPCALMLVALVRSRSVTKAEKGSAAPLVSFIITAHNEERRIREKIKAGETKDITEPEAPERAPRSAKVIDLAALLQQSLKESERAGRKGPRGRSGKPATERSEHAHGRTNARRKRAA